MRVGGRRAGSVRARVVEQPASSLRIQGTLPTVNARLRPLCDRLAEANGTIQRLRDEHQATLDQVEYLEQLAQEFHVMSTALDSSNQALAEANARLEALATTDPLTGLLNHRAMVAALDIELDRCQRYGHSCALLFIDLDHFKALNDGLGHAAGDATLRELGAVVRAALRDVDSLGRWGGPELLCRRGTLPAR